MASSWEQKADMPMPRYRHYSVLVNDKIYILGGYNLGVTKRVQEYDPQTDIWTDKEPLPLQINDKEYDKGLGTHATGEIKVFVIMTGRFQSNEELFGMSA